jgi:hypothetical protein
MNLYLLRDKTSDHFGKTFSSLSSGGKSSNLPVKWSVEEYNISDISGLSHHLILWEDLSFANCLILGDISQQGRQHLKTTGFINRRHNSLERSTNHIIDRAQHVLFLDIEYDDFNDHLDATTRIERFINLLPREFRDASYHAQLSASFGIKEGLRVHLFFWSQRAVSVRAFKEYIKAHSKGLVDHLPLTASNGIIISRPRFIGCEDPYPQRSIYTEKYRSSVRLPKAVFESF